MPFTVARHSKQIPIPHRAVRGSPRSDFLDTASAIAIAAATVDPAITVTVLPLIRSSMRSDIKHLEARACRQIGLEADLRYAAGKLVRQ